MSRSFRHTPIIGITTARSDKPYKRAEHGRERCALREALCHSDGHIHPKAFGNPWSSCKDGKQYLHGERERWLRK